MSCHLESKGCGLRFLRVCSLLIALFCALLAEEASGETTGGGSLGYGYIGEADVDGTTVGGASLLMAQGFLHWKYFGFALELPLITRYSYGKDSDIHVSYLQAKLMLGLRRSDPQGTIFPHVALGVGFFLRDGVNENATTFGGIDKEETGPLTSLGLGILIKMRGGGGLYIEYSFLETEYPEGDATHGLFQIGLVF